MRAFVLLAILAATGCSSLHNPASVMPMPYNLRTLTVYLMPIELSFSPILLVTDHYEKQLAQDLHDGVLKYLNKAGYTVITYGTAAHQLTVRPVGRCSGGFGDQCELKLEATSDRGEPLDVVSTGFRLDSDREAIARSLVDQLDRSPKLAVFVPATPPPPAPAAPSAPPSAPPGACGKDTDCPGNQICAAGVCREPPH